MRYCLLEPVAEIFQAAVTLQSAVKAHLNSDSGEAERLIREADDPKIRLWTERIWGKQSPEIHGFSQRPDSPPHLPVAQRPLPRMPVRSTQDLIIRRDGYHCRFCGIPVIRRDIRQAMHRRYPDALPWGRTNETQHAAFQCMWLQFDHLLPNTRGGHSGLESILVTCAPCNFGRMEWTIDEAGLNDPRDRILHDHWAGFATWRGLEEFIDR